MLIYLFIIYVVSYILMETLWICILEEDGFFLDEFVGLENWDRFEVSLSNIFILAFLPLVTIWGYFEALKEKLEGLGKND